MTKNASSPLRILLVKTTNLPLHGIVGARKVIDLFLHAKTLNAVTECEVIDFGWALFKPDRGRRPFMGGRRL